MPQPALAKNERESWLVVGEGAVAKLESGKLGIIFKYWRGRRTR